MPKPARSLLLLLAMLTVVACGHQTPVGATPRTPVPSPSSPADVGRLLVGALAETRYVSAEGYLAPALRASMPDATLRARWDALARRYGKFVSIGDLTATPGTGTGVTVAVDARFAGGDATLTMTVDPSLLVTALDIPAPDAGSPSAANSGPGGSSAPSPPAGSP